jgi:transcriptional regulator of met regulon
MAAGSLVTDEKERAAATHFRNMSRSDLEALAEAFLFAAHARNPLSDDIEAASTLLDFLKRGS